MALGGGCLLAPSLARAEVYFGPEVRDMSARSVNALTMHQQVMQAQLRLDDTLWHFAITARGTPATLQFAGGERLDAGLNRLSLSMGGGFGKPSDFAFSFGLQAENIGASSWPLFIKGIDGYSANNAQAVYYVAVAKQGYQLSVGGLSDTGFTGLDAQGRFNPTATAYTYRPGAPPEASAAQANVGKRQRSNAFFLSLTQVEGVLLGGTIAQVREQLEDEAKTKLAALRGQLRPERWVKKAARSIPGVPSIGFDVFTPGVDPYADRYASLKKNAEQTAAGLVADAAPKPSTLVQLPLSFEDILGSGAYGRVVPQASPKPTLRMIDAGFAHSFGDEDLSFGLGVRATAFQRTETWTGSAEALVGVTSKYVSGRVAYAYNVPDAALLLPIPNAHVLGVQLVYGRSEVAMPVSPIAATLAQTTPGKRDRDEDGEK